MKVAVITSPHFFVEENAILNAMFEEGLNTLHIRKPDSEPIFCERLLTLLDHKWYDRIIVNDHFYLKNEYNLKGIHLSSRNPELPRGYKGFYTRSCDLYNIDEWKDKCGYVFLDINPAVLHRAQADHHISRNVYAKDIHSIDDILQAKEYGFGGVVLEDIIWDQFDFHESSNYKDLVDWFHELKKAAE